MFHAVDANWRRNMTKEENWIDKIDKKIPLSIKNLLEVVANIATVVTSAGGIYTIIFNFVTTPTPAEGFWRNMIIIALSVGSGGLLWKLNKNRSKYKRELETLQSDHDKELQTALLAHQDERRIVSKNYYQLMHDYRNVINEMECKYKEGKLTDEFLAITVKKFLENALDYLIETLEKMTRQKISGCVKAVIGGNCKRISYNEAKVNTFVRSHNSEGNRRALDEKDEKGVYIRDNTDFMYIVADDREKNDSIFYQPNLKEYDRQLRSVGKVYKNTTPNWDEYYIGTIVAPIRIASKRLFYLNSQKNKETGKNRRRKGKGQKNNSTYYTLGFLCVDSLSEDAFPIEQKANYSHIVKAYAATFFNILSKNQFYIKRLEEKRNQCNDVITKTDTENK